MNNKFLRVLNIFGWYVLLPFTIYYTFVERIFNGDMSIVADNADVFAFGLYVALWGVAITNKIPGFKMD